MENEEYRLPLPKTDYSRHNTSTNESISDKDSSWVRNAFMLPDVAFNDIYYRQNRYASSADMKFTDTRPGGSIGINSRPQFTPYADPRRKGRMPRADLTVENHVGADNGFGVGRYWSENYEDPTQKIYMRFGVPEFNSIANFIRRAFTYEEIVMARRGRTPTWLYDAGKLAGDFVLFRAFPLAAMAFMVWKGVEFVFASPANRYYSFKSTMHYYWMMVQTIINTIMANRGVMPRTLANLSGKSGTQIVGKPYKANSDMMEYFSTLFPDFFVTGDFVAYVDVLAIASRAQRMANKLFLYEYDFLTGQGDIADPSTFKGYLKRRENFVENYISDKSGQATIGAMFNRYMSTGYWRAEESVAKTEGSAEIDPRLKAKASASNDVRGADLNNPDSNADGGATNRISASTAQDIKNQADTSGAPPTTKEEADAKRIVDAAGTISAQRDRQVPGADGSVESALSDAEYMPESMYDVPSPGNTSGWWTEFFDNLDAEFRDGSGFAVFCVDYTGSASESFSNSYGESQLSNTLNSMSSTAKEFRYSTQDGNVIGSTIQGVVQAAGDLVFGLAESVTLGASNLLLGLAGSGYIDIPKHWQNSSANLPRLNYSMTLISPYNNVFSHLINIYLPLAMILAGGVPRSTGRSSYTGPFLCQCFDRGRMQVQLGAIESINITRGTSNLGYSLDGKALAIEVSWSVLDLSSIMHMPIGNGSILGGAATLTLDEDSVAANYLAVVAGQDMYSQIYAMPRAVTRLAKLSSAVGRVGSPYYWSSLMHEKLINGGGLFALTRPLARFYEAVNVGSNVVTSPNTSGTGG